MTLRTKATYSLGELVLVIGTSERQFVYTPSAFTALQKSRYNRDVFGYSEQRADRVDPELIAAADEGHEPRKLALRDVWSHDVVQT